MAMNTPTTNFLTEVPNQQDIVSITAEQRYFLDRLARLTKKSTLMSRYLVPTDRRMRLLSHAIFTTYGDCQTVGAGGLAKIILEHYCLTKSGKRD